MKWIFIILLMFSCGEQSETNSLRKYKKNLLMNEIKLVSDGTLRVKLPLKYLETPDKFRCGFLDGDLVHELKKILNIKDLLMTVENLEDNDSGPIFSGPLEKVSHMKHISGSRFNKLSLENGFYGVFICSDKNETGSCKNKKVIKAQTLIEQAFGAKSPKDSKIKTDHVVYFSPAFMTKDSFFTLEKQDKNYKEIGKVIHQVFGFSKKKQGDLIKISSKWDKLLRNLAIDSEKNYAIVDLPMTAPQCDQKSMRKVYQYMETKVR